MVVGTITYEVSVQEGPKIKVCTLCVRSCEWSCILKDKDKTLTFEVLTLDPTRTVAPSCSQIFTRAEQGRGILANEVP